MRDRGHEVMLTANECYGPLASRLGFSFRTLLSDRDMDRLVGNPVVSRPIRGALHAVTPQRG